MARPYRPAAALLAAAALGLAGCGGGIFLGFGDGFHDGTAPSVSLAAAPSNARVGAVIALVAAASDENGIDRVDFFQLDAAGVEIRLGTDAVSPYQFDAVAPNATSVRYFARATDGSGNRADSQIVIVTIVP